jgi:hypothetical protein
MTLGPSWVPFVLKIAVTIVVVIAATLSAMSALRRWRVHPSV